MKFLTRRYLFPSNKMYSHDLYEKNRIKEIVLKPPDDELTARAVKAAY